MRDLEVFVDGFTTGNLLQAHEGEECVFNYSGNQANGFVSLTMPVRAKSYVNQGMFPIFEMHLPEGYLLSVIKKHFSKMTETDDFGLLKLLSPSVKGRLSYRQVPTGDDPISVDTVLHSGQLGLFADLVKRFALRSAVSGVQPKVLARLQDKATLSFDDYIVKSWGEDCPHLGLNEWLCMQVVKAANLPVPEFYLSDDEQFFVMKRFDITASGSYLGFEDFCVLQAKSRDHKYTGSYEQLAKSIAAFVSPSHRHQAMLHYFKSLVLNQFLQNGDAHLKNFGVLYTSVTDIKLAPVYDVVSTTAYIKSDIQALTLLGSKRWTKSEHLLRFAVDHCNLTIKQAQQGLDDCVQAMLWLQQYTEQLLTIESVDLNRQHLLEHFQKLAKRF